MTEVSMWTIEMILMVALAVITTIGNLLVVVAVYKDPELRSVSNYLVVNLAAADLLIGMVIEPLSALYVVLQHEEKDYAGSKLLKSVAVMRTVAIEVSNLTVLILTVERYILLEMPLRYGRLFSVNAVKTYIFFIWLTGLTVSVPLLPLWNKEEYCCFFFFGGIGFLLLIFMLCLHIRMFIIIRKFNKALFAQGIHQPLMQPEEALLSARKREHEVAKAIFIFYGAFALCWLPSIVVNTIVYKCRSTETDDTFYGVLLVGLLNSALNPVLYSLRMPKFRRAVTRLLCRSSDLE